MDLEVAKDHSLNQTTHTDDIEVGDFPVNLDSPPLEELEGWVGSNLRESEFGYGIGDH